ncbi:MAG TPA: hypothetical protein VF511_07690, partial [Chthoniobacterales bacterium]
QYMDLFAGGIGGEFYPLVFGGDENIYVGDAEYGRSRIKRFNGMTGELIDSFVDYGEGGLWNPADLVFGPDGNLYVSNAGVLYGEGESCIKRYDRKAGAYLGDFVLPGSGGLNRPGQFVFSSTASRLPEVVSITRTETAGVVVRGTGAPNRLYSMQTAATPEIAAFATTSSTRANGVGVMRWQDVPPGEAAARFYRLSAP